MGGAFSKPTGGCGMLAARAHGSPQSLGLVGFRTPSSQLSRVCAAFSHSYTLCFCLSVRGLLCFLKYLANFWPPLFITPPLHHTSSASLFFQLFLPLPSALIPFDVLNSHPVSQYLHFFFFSFWVDPSILGDHLVRAISLRSSFGQAGIMTSTRW